MPPFDCLNVPSNALDTSFEYPNCASKFLRQINANPSGTLVGLAGLCSTHTAPAARGSIGRLLHANSGNAAGESEVRGGSLPAEERQNKSLSRLRTTEALVILIQDAGDL